jgi:hypothetical protein
VPTEQRNMLWLIFTNRQIRTSLTNWEIVASHVVARFRADLSKIPEDRRALALKNKLLDTSPDFARIWKLFRTKEVLNHSVHLIDPEWGAMCFDRVTLRTEIDLSQSVIVYVPKDKASEARLKSACAGMYRAPVRARLSTSRK